MALHLIPAGDRAPHAPDTSCGCGVQRAEGERSDGTHGVTYTHTDQRAELDDDQAAGDER
jgi:hypothetical protein